MSLEKTQGSNTPLRVAFLGLGNMGAPMARNVAKRFPITVWNRTTSRADGLVADGATRSASPRACAWGAQVVVTMLGDAAALRSVLSGADGVLAGIAPGALLIDMSTVGRAAAVEAAQAAAAAGASFVDAPVSGSVGPAERAELVAMAGGEAGDVARAEPVLRSMCKRILLAGPVGQGQALKVILNGVGAHHLVAFTSMLVLGERAGLARETIVEAFTTGAFASPSYVGKKPKVLARDYAPEFSLALTQKDAELNAQLQDEVGLTLPVQREVLREVIEAVRGGLGDEDLFALEKYFAALPARSRM